MALSRGSRSWDTFLVLKDKKPSRAWKEQVSTGEDLQALLTLTFS